MLQIGLLLTILLAACEHSASRSANDALEIAPQQLTFPEAFLGSSTSVVVRFTNHGQPWTPSRMDTEDPFSVIFRAPLGDPQAVVIVFTPFTDGGQSRTLTVGDGVHTASILLEAFARAVPECSIPPECQHVRFDREAGACVNEPLPDGTPCLAACSATTRCHAGVCEGTEHLCDDGDGCTVDQCLPSLGCSHALVNCHLDPNRCFASRCNPDTGQCEQRGTGPASGSCDWLPAQQLAPAWSYSATEPDTRLYFEGILDAAGRPYALACRQVSPFACKLLSLAPDGRVRFSSPVPAAAPDRWTPATVAVVDDVALVNHDGGQALAAFRTTDGALLWDKTAAALVPQLSSALQPVLGRIVALGAGAMAVTIAGNRDELLGLAFLDATTGALRTWLDGSGAHWTRAIGDGKGTLFLQVQRSEQGQAFERVDAIDAATGPLWSSDEVVRHDNAPAYPSADVAADGLVLADNGTVVDAASGRILLSGGAAGQRAPGSTLAGSGSVFARGGFSDGDCSGVRFRRLSPRAGTTEASCDFVTSSPESALLTRTGSVLFLPGPSTTDALVEVSADAQPLFVAQLAGAFHPRVSALAPGRLYVPSSSASTLLAFDLPGQAPAEHGWIAPRGNQQGTWSALP